MTTSTGASAASSLVTSTADAGHDQVRARPSPSGPRSGVTGIRYSCAPCTNAVVAGEDPRSGRWAGLSKTECGLHV